MTAIQLFQPCQGLDFKAWLMRVDVNLTSLNLQDRDQHFIHAEAHGERRQPLHLPAFAFFHPVGCDRLDFPNNQALILGQKQLNEPGLIADHVVPVGSKRPGDAMSMHEPVAEHARNAGHVINLSAI